MTTVKQYWLSFASTSPPRYIKKEAFSRLYDETNLHVFRYVYGLLGGAQEDAEDITAQTYLKAWDARHDFEGTLEQARAWLFTIAKRIVIDGYRKQKVRPTLVNIEEGRLTSFDATPEEHLVKTNQMQYLWHLLDDLPTDDREMLVLRYMLDWQVKEIAKHMTLKPNTVSVRLRRLIEQLQGLWNQQRQMQGDE